MIRPERRPRVSVPNVMLGITQLARGRAEGLRQFGDTRQAFLNSLAPLIAFPLVGTLLMLGEGQGAGALSDLLMTVCALLAPPVLSHALARAWGREALWLRFATAFNWCQWAIPVALALMLLLAGLLMAAGLPVRAAGDLAMGGLAAYGLWLHWFLARHALRLPPGRAVLLVGCVNLGTVLLVVGPLLLAQAMLGQAPPGQALSGQVLSGQALLGPALMAQAVGAGGAGG